MQHQPDARQVLRHGDAERVTANEATALRVTSSQIALHGNCFDGVQTRYLSDLLSARVWNNGHTPSWFGRGKRME